MLSKLLDEPYWDAFYDFIARIEIIPSNNVRVSSPMWRMKAVNQFLEMYQRVRDGKILLPEEFNYQEVSSVMREIMEKEGPSFFHRNVMEEIGQELGFPLFFRAKCLKIKNIEILIRIHYQIKLSPPQSCQKWEEVMEEMVC